MVSAMWAAGLALLTFMVCAEAQQLFVVAPNTLRINAEETVAVFSHSGQQDVSIYLTDSGKKREYSKSTITVLPNVPQTVKVIVKPEDIPDLEITGNSKKHYVLLVARAPNFSKEIKILVNPSSGYFFLQTDKPIYTPTQPLNIRIISLDEDMRPDNQTFKLQIRNPQNIIMESIPSSELKSPAGIYNYNFKFPKFPLLGEWSAVVLYGSKIPKNSTITFKVEKYVLPTFEVKLTVPDAVLETDETVKVTVKAEYVYGRKVEGFVNFKFGYKSEARPVVYFGKFDATELVDGEGSCEFEVGELRDHNSIGWFPNIKGGHLVVEAVVTETVTGDKEMASESSTVFASSPYLISFKRCLLDYKPGLAAVVEADITHVSGKPARNIPTSIEVKDENGKDVQVRFPTSISTGVGRVIFFINTAQVHKFLKITIRSNAEHLSANLQAEGKHVMRAFSSSGSYIALDRTDGTTALKVGDLISLTVYSTPDQNIPLSYLISSQGRIVDKGSLIEVRQVQKSIQFLVTPQMVPSIRIVLFAHNGKELLTDSIKLDVVDICTPNAQIDLEVNFKDTEPGSVGDIIIKGTPNTAVGILAVDKAVYALRNKDLLTKDKMFKEMEEHDLGCGPGGGGTSDLVLANAGIVMMTNAVNSATERPDYSCSERKRRKREIRENIVKEHGKLQPMCCKLATFKDEHQRTCEERAELIELYDGEEPFEGRIECASVFLACCQKSEYIHTPLLMVRSKGVKADMSFMDSEEQQGRAGGEAPADELTFIDDDALTEHEDGVQVRKDFKETWHFDVVVIGVEGHHKITSNLPHSITTWVVQAVGVVPFSMGGGMCVADPKSVVGFKKMFLQVKMPYSVVRKEQIEIQVTVFNYGSKRLPVVLYMYGVENLCSEAQPNEKSTSKRIWVQPHSSASTGFAMVPLEAKEYSLKFVGSSSEGSDIVVKTLNVIAEGVPHEENIVFSIDPSNTEKRKRRNLVSEKITLKYDEEKKQQLAVIALVPEIEYVPGTESVYISAIGDKFGSTIKTSLENPDSLIKMPQGCGEQNMAFMAPTLYTLHYLKATEKVTAKQETNGYTFIREGYKRELGFRKPDGSYAAFLQRASSTWLTAFVAKVFCQAQKYIFVDDNVVTSALQWLANGQKPDGTFEEKYAIVHREMMGGIQGAVPLTAFVLLAMEKCSCDRNKINLENQRKLAVDYLKSQIPLVNDPYRLAIATYALAVAGPEFAIEGNTKLMSLAQFDPDLNRRHWGDGKSSQSLEATSYALQIQLLFENIDVATSIVNWMNTQRKVGGSFWSTQDTVAAIEALSEYAIKSRDPDMSLVCNVTYTNDPTFKETLSFRQDNARVLQVLELTKLGGRINIESEGSGVSNIGIQLRYNIPVNPDTLCKFDISVNITEAKEFQKNVQKKEAASGNDLKKFFPRELMQQFELEKQANANLSEAVKHIGHINLHDRQRGRHTPLANVLNDIRNHRRPKPKHLRAIRSAAVIPQDGKSALNSKYILNVTICTKYLGNENSNMAVVEAGIFTGFKPFTKELKQLVNDTSLKIAKFEETGRKIVFYLDEVSNKIPVCFSFRIAREFVVSSLESSLVRVYDYYEPEHACSEFYRPDQESALIRTVCTGAICSCAEGGCPAKEPFEEVKRLKKIQEQRQLLQEIACEKHDFVWKAKVDKKIKEKSGFLKITFRVESVLKEGLETTHDLVDDLREFIARGSCETANLLTDQTYIIMGRDQEPAEIEGKKTYRYFIDKTTRLYEWLELRKHPRAPTAAKDLQKNFMHLERLFMSKKGCLN